MTKVEELIIITLMIEYPINGFFAVDDHIQILITIVNVWITEKLELSLMIFFPSSSQPKNEVRNI